MAFPDDELDVHVELFYSGVWNDITTDVRVADGITITEGRADESSASQPSTLSLALDNTSGKYSPRNPASPLFGLIGRNTPLRVRIGDLDPGGALVMPGNAGSYLSAPHATGDDITGDIDIRLELEFGEWPTGSAVDDPANTMGLARRYVTNEDNRAWLFRVVNKLVPAGSPVGTLAFTWSADGDATISAVSTDVIDPTGVIALRVTLDVDDGAGNHVVTFYTSDAIDGIWTQLGAPVTTAGPTALFASDADLEAGRINALFGAGPLARNDGLLSDPFYGQLRAVEVRSGIDGTVINSADLTTPEAGTRTFTSAQGDTWTTHGGAHFTDASILFAGEVSNWPPRWNKPGTNITAQIEAAGISRRLGQGAKPLKSVMSRGIASTPAVVASGGYWPCEEGSSEFTGIPTFLHDPQISFASALGAAPATFTGEVDPGSYSGFGAATAPIPEYGLDGRLDCILPFYTPTDNQRVIALVHVPDAGVAVETRLLAVVTSGTVRRWEIMLNAAGSLRVRAFDEDENLLVDDGFSAFAVNDKNLVLTLRLRQLGADVEYGIATLDAETGVALQVVDTLAGNTYGRVLQVHTARAGDDLAGTAVGHVVVDTLAEGSAFTLLSSLLTGLTGESAADRVSRLVDEEDVPAVLDVGLDFTEPMGGQRIATLLDLLREAAASDLAVIGDARDQLAISWRDRHSLYSQTPALELDYAAGQIAEITPEEDDQLTRNDVEAERVGGSSFRATLESGPLSTAAPPDGVGRYDESVSLSLADDDQLEGQAYWRLHLGTVDELRYPVVAVEVAAAPDLMDAVNAVKVGDLIRLTDLPEWLPPGDVDLLVNHIERRLGTHTYTVTFTCAPGGPWQALRLDVGQRVSSSSTVTVATVGPADTTVAVDSIWTPDVTQAPFDVLVGGELMTVTAVSVTGSNSTLTVTRQLALSHPAGTRVKPAPESFVGL